MQEKMDSDEGILDNLRGVVERDNTKILNLETEICQLKVDLEKKNDLISKLEKEAEEDRETWETASCEIFAKSAAIRAEYEKALATFGAEPSPFPEDAEGGVAGLLDWLLGEFEVFGGVLSSVSDNTAVMTCESIMAVLSHEGCPELERIASQDFIFLEYFELDDEIAKIQAMNKSFLQRFWEVSGGKWCGRSHKGD